VDSILLDDGLINMDDRTKIFIVSWKHADAVSIGTTGAQVHCISPNTHVKHVRGESASATILLDGLTYDDLPLSLVEALRAAMVTQNGQFVEIPNRVQ
jgi:hypothetical protein